MLRKMYKIAIKKEPFSNNSCVSNAKDENVVKPLQNPTFIKSTILGLREFFSESAAIIPIIKQPITLIKNVFIGNPFFYERGINPIK